MLTCGGLLVVTSDSKDLFHNLRFLKRNASLNPQMQMLKKYINTDHRP